MALTHEQVFQLFAQSNRAVFDAVYRPSVRPLLSEAAAAFWEGVECGLDEAGGSAD